MNKNKGVLRRFARVEHVISHLMSLALPRGPMRPPLELLDTTKAQPLESGCLPVFPAIMYLYCDALGAIAQVLEHRNNRLLFSKCNTPGLP